MPQKHGHEEEMARPWIRRIGKIIRILIATVVVVVAALVFRWAVLFLWFGLLPRPEDTRTIIAIAIVALALLAAIWWLWWRLPRRQLHRLDVQIHDPKDRADTEDNFRKTVGQALGGAAVLIGAVVAYLQFAQQQQTASQQILEQHQASEKSLRASQDLLISNQVSKGFEQLASDKLAMRLGGIYALEGVMKGSDQYHQPVLEALCAFVRESTKGNASDETATDVQAALTVIGRRGPGEGGINLQSARIPKAELSRADLAVADLHRATLRGADLHRATLRGADLNDADLHDVSNLTQMQLDQACGKPKALPPGLTLDKPCSEKLPVNPKAGP
jgi:uncharacterized protein YjbI with pentapeptide repeats